MAYINGLFSSLVDLQARNVTKATVYCLFGSIEAKYYYIFVNNDNTVTFDTPFYMLAGLGGGILILTFCIIIMCICFCLHIPTVPLGRKKRQMLTFTADNVEDDEHSWQQNGK